MSYRLVKPRNTMVQTIFNRGYSPRPTIKKCGYVYCNNMISDVLKRGIGKIFCCDYCRKHSDNFETSLFIRMINEDMIEHANAIMSYDGTFRNISKTILIILGT